MVAKKLIPIWCLIAAFFFPGSSNAFDNYVNVRVIDYPPATFIDESGKWTGIDVELARAVIEGAGLEPRFIPSVWSGALKRMKMGDLHFMMDLTITDERSEYLHWIGPERDEITVLVVKKKDINLPVRSLDDIPIIAKERGKKIGVVKGARYSDEFNEKIKNQEFSASFEMVATQNLNLRKLNAGRILGYFTDKENIEYRIKHDPLFRDIAIHGFVLAQRPVYFGVSKKVSPNIYTLLKESFHRLEANGVLDKIRSSQW
ncbi:MAG: amino acid ABC transporter substrate-binding protein [Desulfobacteraceae bacterium]|nr:amino acid ABC transporter substrate-binding protein [Desulfobacteraceae bacterium]